MAEHDSTSWDDLPVLRDAIAASLGAPYWTVDDGDWSGIEPSLPDGVGELLAEPVMVGSAPLGPETDLPEMPSAPAVETVESAADPLTLIVRDVEPPRAAPTPRRPGRHRRMRVA